MTPQNETMETTATATFLLDGEEVTAKNGQTILEAAAAQGIYIPRLCYREGMPPGGHCRVCTVMVDGRPASACTYPAGEGLVVESNTDDLNSMRQQVVEMLFVEGNHICPACEASGNCELQAVAYRLGMTTPRYPHLNPVRELDASHPDVLIDRDRCILCGRCARASRALDGKSVFAFEGRGIDMRIAVDAPDGLAGTDAEATDEAVAACPVGCLLVKRQGYQVPVGQRTYDTTPIGTEVEARSRRAAQGPATSETSRSNER